MEPSSRGACIRIDDTFGPHAGPCRGGFDFTLLFEEIILTLLPAGIILLALPFRLWYLAQRVKKVQANSRSLTVIKLVS